MQSVKMLRIQLNPKKHSASLEGAGERQVFRVSYRVCETAELTSLTNSADVSGRSCPGNQAPREFFPADPVVSR